MSVQCCLKESDEAPSEYLLAIDQEDCGHDWGLCGEGNEPAFSEFGEDECMRILFAKALENELSIG